MKLIIALALTLASPFALASGKFSLEPRVNADTGKTLLIYELGINEPIASAISAQGWIAYGESYAPEAEGRGALSELSAERYVLARAQLTFDCDFLHVSPGARVTWKSDDILGDPAMSEVYARLVVDLW